MNTNNTVVLVGWDRISATCAKTSRTFYLLSNNIECRWHKHNHTENKRERKRAIECKQEGRIQTIHNLPFECIEIDRTSIDNSWQNVYRNCKQCCIIIKYNIIKSRKKEKKYDLIPCLPLLFLHSSVFAYFLRFWAWLQHIQRPAKARQGK